MQKGKRERARLTWASTCIWSVILVARRSCFPRSFLSCSISSSSWSCIFSRSSWLRFKTTAITLKYLHRPNPLFREVFGFQWDFPLIIGIFLCIFGFFITGTDSKNPLLKNAQVVLLSVFYPFCPWNKDLNTLVLIILQVLSSFLITRLRWPLTWHGAFCLYTLILCLTFRFTWV